MKQIIWECTCSALLVTHNKKPPVCRGCGKQMKKSSKEVQRGVGSLNKFEVSHVNEAYGRGSNVVTR